MDFNGGKPGCSVPGLATSASQFYAALPAKPGDLSGATCVTLQRKSFKRRSVLSLVPTRLGHSSSILPAIIRQSICREGSACLLRPHSTRTRSSLQTRPYFPTNGSTALFPQNQFAGKETSACCVPTQQGHAPPCKPMTVPGAFVPPHDTGLSFQSALMTLMSSR